jgi:hypothetical protein
MHHEEPAGETLLDAVEAVAGGGLSGLHALNYGVTVGDVLEVSAVREKIAKGLGTNTKAIAGDLNDGAVRIAGKSDESGRTSHAFIADDADLNRLALAGDDDNGDETAIWKVNKLKLVAGLVEASVAREILERK